MSKSDWDERSDNPLMDIHDISDYTGYAEGTLRNKRSRGEMPPPDVEGHNHVRWRLSTIRAWDWGARPGGAGE